MVTLNGDLSKLLIAKPAGAKDWDFDPFPDGWSSLGEMAYDYSAWALDQSNAFTMLNADGFRRVAGRVWTTSDGLSARSPAHAVPDDGRRRELRRWARP